jgi:hypothetical protein
MKITFITFITLLLSFYSSTSDADGNELISWCNTYVDMLGNNNRSFTNTEYIQAGMCHGIAQGIRDMNTIHSALKKTEKEFFCIPENVQTGQLVKVIIKHLNDNPAKLHDRDSSLIFFAYKNSFPCK